MAIFKVEVDWDDGQRPKQKKILTKASSKGEAIDRIRDEVLHLSDSFIEFFGCTIDATEIYLDNRKVYEL